VVHLKAKRDTSSHFENVIIVGNETCRRKFMSPPQFAKPNQELAINVRREKQRHRMEAHPEDNNGNTSHAESGYFTVGRGQKEKQKIKKVLVEGVKRRKEMETLNKEK
jgi:hypothetical protein